MISINCDSCASELREPGALAFSPPMNPNSPLPVLKVHICDQCWQEKFVPLLKHTVNPL